MQLFDFTKSTPLFLEVKKKFFSAFYIDRIEQIKHNDYSLFSENDEVCFVFDDKYAHIHRIAIPPHEQANDIETTIRKKMSEYIDGDLSEIIYDYDWIDEHNILFIGTSIKYLFEYINRFPDEMSFSNALPVSIAYWEALKERLIDDEFILFTRQDEESLSICLIDEKGPLYTKNIKASTNETEQILFQELVLFKETYRSIVSEIVFFDQTDKKIAHNLFKTIQIPIINADELFLRFLDIKKIDLPIESEKELISYLPVCGFLSYIKGKKPYTLNVLREENIDILNKYIYNFKKREKEYEENKGIENSYVKNEKNEINNNKYLEKNEENSLKEDKNIEPIDEENTNSKFDNGNDEDEFIYRPINKSQKNILPFVIVCVLLFIALSIAIGFGVTYSMRSSNEKITPTQIASISPTEEPKPTDAPITKADLIINILNGSGKAGYAKKYADILKTAGFEDPQVGNADDSTYKESVIKIKKSKKLAVDLMKETFKDLVFSSKTEDLPDDDQYDIVIVLGSELK